MITYAKNEHGRVVYAKNAGKEEKCRCWDCGIPLYPKRRGETFYFAHYAGQGHKPWCVAYDDSPSTTLELEKVTPDRFRRSIMGWDAARKAPSSDRVAAPTAMREVPPEQVRNVGSLKDIVRIGLSYASDFDYTEGFCLHDLILNCSTAEICLAEAGSGDLGYRCIVARPNFVFRTEQIIRFTVFWKTDDGNTSSIYFDMHFSDGKKFEKAFKQCFLSTAGFPRSRYKAVLIYGDWKAYSPAVPVSSKPGYPCLGYFTAEYTRSKQLYCPDFQSFLAEENAPSR